MTMNAIEMETRKMMTTNAGQKEAEIAVMTPDFAVAMNTFPCAGRPADSALRGAAASR